MRTKITPHRRWGIRLRIYYFPLPKRRYRKKTTQRTKITNRGQWLYSPNWWNNR